MGGGAAGAAGEEARAKKGRLEATRVPQGRAHERQKGSPPTPVSRTLCRTLCTRRVHRQGSGMPTPPLALPARRSAQRHARVTEPGAFMQF